MDDALIVVINTLHHVDTENTESKTRQTPCSPFLRGAHSSIINGPLLDRSGISIRVGLMLKSVPLRNADSRFECGLFDCQFRQSRGVGFGQGLGGADAWCSVLQGD